MARIIGGLFILWSGVFCVVGAAQAHADPTLDQRCLSPAYAHMHEAECLNATNPSDYN